MRHQIAGVSVKRITSVPGPNTMKNNIEEGYEGLAKNAGGKWNYNKGMYIKYIC